VSCREFSTYIGYGRFRGRGAAGAPKQPKGETMRTKLPWLTFAVALCAVAAVWIAASPAGASSAGSSQIPRTGTGSPQTGDFTPSSGDSGQEFLGEDEEDGPTSYSGTITLSSGAGGGASVTSATK